MNNEKPCKWSNFKEFKEKYNNVKWDVDERFNWFFNIKSRDYNFRVDKNGFFSHQNLLHAKIIRFDDQNMKLFPLSLIRAILYVKKIDKQKNLKKCPSCNSQRVKRKIEKTTYTYKNHSLKVDQPGIYCDNCGEIFLSSDDMRCNKTELEKFKNKINESNS